MSYQCESWKGCNKKATWHSSNDVHACDEHIAEAAKCFTGVVWKNGRSVATPPKIKVENLNSQQQTHTAIEPIEMLKLLVNAWDNDTVKTSSNMVLLGLFDRARDIIAAQQQ